jgi:hypothetical protein
MLNDTNAEKIRSLNDSFRRNLVFGGTVLLTSADLFRNFSTTKSASESGCPPNCQRTDQNCPVVLLPASRGQYFPYAWDYVFPVQRDAAHDPLMG